MRRSTVVLAVVAAASAGLRLYFCVQLPVNTGDVLRHLFHGLYVLRDGLATAGLPLAELAPGLVNVSWARFAYNYPPVTLGFFTALAAVSPTIFAAKLALTGVEAINAWLVGRLAGRWVGLLYWCSPASIWWVSGEGQFEPLQATFMLGALVLLRRSPPWAFALLALGVQVKFTAVLLLPWLLWSTWREDPRALRPAAAAFGVALLPTAIASPSYPVLDAFHGTFGMLRYNPYFWDLTSREIFLWNPGWLIAANAITSYGTVGLLGWRAGRSSEPVAYAGAIAFLAIVKLSSLAQFWYMLLMPAFLAPIPERRWRWWLIALAPLLDVRSLIELLTGPFGWTMGNYYMGVSVFQAFQVP